MKKRYAKKRGWENVPPIHRKRIINSYKESFNPKNWIDHEEVKKKHAIWLKPSNKNNDWWDELTDIQKADLEIAIAETEDPTKLVSHEEVIKMSRQWLNEDTPLSKNDF